MWSWVRARPCTRWRYRDGPDGSSGSKALPLRRLLCVLAIAVAGVGVASTAQSPTLDEVLARAGEYVAGFHSQLAGIVLEEDYLQDLLPGPLARGPVTSSRRRLRSDLLMVRLASDERWVQFRDVFEVDGRAVRDRDQRLARLFLEPSRSSLTQADAIARESSRYNVGNLERTINLPMLALAFFDPVHRRRSIFERVDAGNVKGLARTTGGADIWAVRYRETAQGTLIRTKEDRDMPANGRAWIDVATGRVLRTELAAGSIEVHARIEVTYRLEPGLGFLVPSEMREDYTNGQQTSRIRGWARYGSFKRFTVKTEETLKKPPG